MRCRQTGAGGFLIAVILLLVIGGALAALAFLQSRGQGERSAQDDQRFETIKTAMGQYVTLNGRLPCPANPAVDTGAAEPATAAATCTYPQGTVPWSTIGVRRDDAIDAWGWKISYRVYTGTAGSLTQTSGASMVNCDTGQTLSAGRTQVAGSAGGLCRNARDTLDSEFLAGKGLTINWFGTAIADAAYVLVSHGPSGLGAYAASGSAQNSLPASANELANLAAAGPFVATSRTAASVAPSDAAHFDDVLAYQRIPDLVRIAGVGAREWADTTGYSDVALTAANVDAALEATADGNLGQTTLNVANARITGLLSGSANELSYDRSVEGLGGASGDSQLTSSAGEGIRVEFNQEAGQLAVTLKLFGTFFAGSVWEERARFDFYNGSSLVHSQTKNSCRTPETGETHFNIDVESLVGQKFDRVEITPRTTSVSFGISLASQFVLAAFKTCATGVGCVTSLYEVGNFCS